MRDVRKVYKDFEQLVRELLLANGYKLVNPTKTGERYEYDFLVQQGDGIEFAVEVKFYRTFQAQTDLLLVAASRLEHIQTGKILVVSAVVSDTLRHTIEERGVNVVDASNLSFWARVNPKLVERLEAALESNAVGIEPKAVHIETRSVKIETNPSTAMATTPSPIVVATNNEGEKLCSNLRALKCGKQAWRKHEMLCEQILKYLFLADLRGWYQQSWTDGKLMRYDLICRVTAVTKFWALVYNHLSSEYVVFEFKNYCEPIEQGQILTTEKYLNERALRRVAFVLTRKGETENAKKTRQGAIRDAGKLILVLSDDDLCKMLHMRDAGDDPTDHLFDLADEFLISLPR